MQGLELCCHGPSRSQAPGRHQEGPSAKCNRPSGLFAHSHARKRYPPPFRKSRGPSVLALVLSAVSHTDDAAGVTSRHHQHQQDFFPRAIGADQVLAAFPLPIYYIICPHRHAPSLKLRGCSACESHMGPSSKHTLFHSRRPTPRTPGIQPHLQRNPHPQRTRSPRPVHTKSL
jgi:hypothetical protein